jgi:hypothetical protein
VECGRSSSACWPATAIESSTLGLGGGDSAPGAMTMDVLVSFSKITELGVLAVVGVPSSFPESWTGRRAQCPLGNLKGCHKIVKIKKTGNTKSLTSRSVHCKAALSQCTACRSRSRL